MLLLTLLFIILPAVAAELLDQARQKAIYDAEPASARKQTLIFAKAGKCIAPCSDLQEAYHACCLGFDQEKVDLDGAQCTIYCHQVFGLDPPAHKEFSDPASCARQCTKTADCKHSQLDGCKKCVSLSENLKERDNMMLMVAWERIPGNKYEQEVEQLKSENADLEGMKKAAESETRLQKGLRTLLSQRIKSCEKLVARVFGHRDATLNALFQEATLDVRSNKYKMYFGKRFSGGILVDSSYAFYPWEHHTFTSCLEACSKDDDCKAAEYDPESQDCQIVTRWKGLENVQPDLYNGRSISAIRIGRKWEVVVANKARKVLEAIQRVL
jgi:hypothetical protein